MVLTPDDPTFFAGETHGKYHRAGTEETTGLKLNVYQELLRFMHLADNTTREPVESDEYDRCFHIRPLIKLLQACFPRWCTPGKNNALDEGPIPSRFHWLRNFNPDKPNRYFIELLMACCSISRF